ncbi:hypothetical protein V6Z11_A12G048100 [Gossypium hirsutum]
MENQTEMTAFNMEALRVDARRLSRYYFGKARLFACTADVSGIEDLKSITMLRMKYSKLKIKEMQLFTPYLYRDGALCTATELHLHLALVWQYNQRYHLLSDCSVGYALADLITKTL